MLGDIGIGTGIVHPGEIASFELPTISQHPSVPLLLRVKNTSLNFFTAKPILKIKPFLFGDERTQFLEEKIIFPSKIRRWQSMVTLENIGIGIYHVTMQVSTGNGNIIQTTRTLIIFPWKPVLIFLIIALVLLWSVKNRTRLQKAMKALVSQEEQN